MEINKVLAFDIGGTKIAYATVDRNGKILNEVIRHPTPAAPGAAAKLLKTIIAQFEDQIDAVAVSTAGTVDRTNSRITGSVGNMPEGYMDTDFKALSTKPVVVENDANSAVWAEHVLGNAKGYDNVILLTLGTGVGVGIIADGRLLVGKSGQPAKFISRCVMTTTVCADADAMIVWKFTCPAKLLVWRPKKFTKMIMLPVIL